MRIIPVAIKNKNQAEKLMVSLGVSSQGVKILSSKVLWAAFQIEDIKSWEANILKQHLLSQGSDAAIERDALVKNIKTKALIFGNLSQLRNLCRKLENQPFSLHGISEVLSVYLDNLNRQSYAFTARDKKFKITQPLICGIINLTPDSFSGDGLLGKSREVVLAKVAEMLRRGAKIIDVGGESSRPFAKPLKEKEELNRVIPQLRAIRKKFKKVLISIDTYKYEVAKAAVDEGADMINDITALRGDSRKALLVKRHKLGCILMHMKGNPSTMQSNPVYKDVVSEEIDFFQERLSFCRSQGIAKEQIMLDPGIGFGKRLNDNLKILNQLYRFRIFGLPLFLGLSRKSFIGTITKAGQNNRLAGTVAAMVLSLNQGASVFRVHDVGETAQALKVASQIINN